MRRLNAVTSDREPLKKLVKELDAFPKIDECYVETNARSGGVSLLMFCVLGLLIGSQIYNYSNSEVVYEYGVDTDTSSMLKINIDLTIAMPCAAIGADLLDITGKHSIDHENRLEEIGTTFELTRQQEIYQLTARQRAQLLQKKYHSMHESIWDKGYRDEQNSFPETIKNPRVKLDACRFRGSLHTRKLSGNFHVTLGKPINFFGGGHAHLSVMTGDAHNFSHRIHHLSFGDTAAGRVHPLDGDEHITSHDYHIFQYFVKVVPTKVNTRFSYVDTYQYSVTSRDRVLDHNAGSHGTPGIFMKYDFSPIKVYVAHKYTPFWKFLVRLCGIVGGIFACTGIFNSILDVTLDIVCCRLKLGKYKPKDIQTTQISTSSLTDASIPSTLPGGNIAISSFPITTTDTT